MSQWPCTFTGLACINLVTAPGVGKTTEVELRLYPGEGGGDPEVMDTITISETDGVGGVELDFPANAGDLLEAYVTVVTAGGAAARPTIQIPFLPAA